MFIIKIPQDTADEPVTGFVTTDYADTITTISESLDATNAYFQWYDSFNDFCSYMIENEHPIENYLSDMNPQHSLFSVELDDSGSLSCDSYCEQDDLDEAETAYWLEKLAENNLSENRSEVLSWEHEIDARKAGEAMKDGVVKTTLMRMFNAPNCAAEVIEVSDVMHAAVKASNEAPVGDYVLTEADEPDDYEIAKQQVLDDELEEETIRHG